LAALAMALLLAGATMLGRARREERSRRAVDAALARRRGDSVQIDHGVQRPVSLAVEHASRLGERWGAGGLGASLLAAEDRMLVDVCGFANTARARALFIFSRVALACLLPLALWA